VLANPCAAMDRRGLNDVFKIRIFDECPAHHNALLKMLTQVGTYIQYASSSCTILQEQTEIAEK